MRPMPSGDDPKSKSEELIELHTGDVQLLTPSGETPIATKPAPPQEKPFDPEATLPVEDPAKPFSELLQQQASKMEPDGKGWDPEKTDKGAFRPPSPSERPPPEELVTDPTGRGQPSQPSQPSGPLKPARLFDNVPMQRVSGEKPLELSLPGRTVLPPPAADPAFLCVTRGPGQGTSVAVPDGEHPIGRSASCFLCLAHTSVSREHALFKRVGNQFYIRDAASGGGTKINGVRLEGTAEVVPGDQIQIGASVLVLRHGPVVGPEMTDPLGFSVARSSKKSGGVWLWVGAIATSLASAALASVLLTPLGERLFHSPPRAIQMPVTPAMTAPEKPAPAEPAPKPAAGEPEVDSVDVNLDSEIQVKTARREDLPPAGDPLEPVARPAPKPAPRVARRDPALAPPAPKPLAPTTKASEALRLFNEGEVDASINAAKDSGSAALAVRLTNFRKEAALAEAARAGGDPLAAVRHLSAAAAIDESLTRGWSKPGTEVRAELTRLLLGLAEKSLSAGAPAQAVVYLEKALVYGPGNEKATTLLKDAKARKAGAATPASEPPKDSRSEADKAFEQ